MKNLKFSLLLMSLVAVALNTVAQTETELLTQLLEEERSSIEALALYPDDARLAILESAKYPEVLVKLETMQTRTSESFTSLMKQYPDATQKMMWDLTRYPGLIGKLIQPEAQLDEVLASYPSEIHERAKLALRDYATLLNKMHHIEAEWQSAFNSLLKDYPPALQNALRSLIELPEVLTTLTDNLRMTILVGDLYKKNPAWLLQQMDSLHLAVARERTKELEAWKKSLDDNPAAKEELASAAQSYAGDYPYDDVYYDYEADDLYYQDYEADDYVVEHHYYYYPYPYWFGYPYWYLYPRWRPYPWWYDWGFYFGPGRVIVIIDLPSFYFTNWYFHYPYHHYYYPHLSSQFVNHYYGHRATGSSITASVERWKDRNRDIITDAWLERARTKADAFKEYGNFESSRERYNATHQDKPLSQREYLDKNSRRYPTLGETTGQQQRRQPTLPETQPPDRRQQIEPPKTKHPDSKVPAPPAKKPETRIPERQKGEAAPPKTEVPKVDKAQEYHRNKWEKQKTEPPRKDNAPAVRSAPEKNQSRQKPETKPRSQAQTKQPAQKKSRKNG